MDQPVFIKGCRVKMEETRIVEFKHVSKKTNDPVSQIKSKVEDYVVAFLNTDGGSIYWGIDDGGIAQGVGLDFDARNQLRTEVSNKLSHIQPSSAWTPGTAKVDLHSLRGSVGAPEPLSDEYVVEVSVPSTGRLTVYLTSSGECYVRTDGGIQKLNGDQLLRLIYERELSKKLDKPSAAAATNYWGFASVMGRIALVRPVLRDARVLWVDDQPENNFYERLALTDLGVQIDITVSTEEAISFLEHKTYHAIISDMNRRGIPDEGLRMLRIVPASAPPMVFYTFDLTKSLGVPPGAFGITNQPDELMHLLLDILERTRL